MDFLTVLFCHFISLVFSEMPSWLHFFDNILFKSVDATRLTLAIVSFFFFTKVRKFEKMLSADGRVGVWIVKGKHESYGNEGRTRVWHLDKKLMKAGVFCEGFFVKRLRRILLSFVITGVDKVMGKRGWKKAGMSGDRWKHEDGIMFFI